VDLLQGNPHIDELIPMEESRGCLGLFRWLGWVSQLRLKEFDTAFLFHRSFTRALVLRLAGIPHRIGYRTLKRGWLLSRSIEPPKKDSIHKAAFFLQLVEAAGISPDHLHYDAGFSCEDQKSAEQLLEKIGL